MTLSDAGISLPVIADAILIQPISQAVVTSDVVILSGGLHDFGTMALGEVSYETFTVTNTGSAPLELSNLTVEGLTIAELLGIAGGYELTEGFAETSVPAGASTTFEVRFGPDLLGSNDNNNYDTNPLLTGDYTGVVTFDTNDDAGSYTFDLLGEIGDSQPVIIDNQRPSIDSNNDGVNDIFAERHGGTFAIGGFTHYTGRQGYLDDVAYSAAASGNTAIWDFTPVDLADGVYQVAVNWSTHANRATDAPYTVVTNGGSTTIDVDQQAAPSSFEDGGAWWEVLGEFTVTGGVLTVELSDDANGYVIADGVRVQQVGLQIVDQIDEAGVIDDGEAGFTVVGGTLSTYSGANNAFNDDLYYFVGDGNGDFARWDFHVTPGIYVVGVSWVEHSNRATDASYDISTPSGANDASVLIDQQLAVSADQTGEGTVVIDDDRFQILTTIVVPALDNQLSVRLPDATVSGGYLIADAAFVMRVGDPVLPLAAGADARVDSQANAGSAFGACDVGQRRGRGGGRMASGGPE